MDVCITGKYYKYSRVIIIVLQEKNMLRIRKVIPERTMESSMLFKLATIGGQSMADVVIPAKRNN